MTETFDKRRYFIALFIYLSSLCLFILGLTNPILGSEILLGIKKSQVFLTDTFQYFFRQGDWFLGCVLIVFTLILPILKYLVLLSRLISFDRWYTERWQHLFEMLNKWAMLDVFIVALFIMTFKFESTIFDNYVMIGASYFAGSIILLIISSQLLNLKSV